jgi:3-phosphoshikimate 1-carboxyvinyltransferase
MAAPAAKSPLKLSVEGPLVSAPYIEMTLSVMDAFGVKVTRSEAMTFDIAPQPYLARNYPIEPDASAASYFWAAAAITGGRVRVEGLTSDSLQGDVAFCDCLRQMGCLLEQDEGGTTVVGGPLEGITVDMRDFSDTVQTLAAVALFAKGTTTIEGVEHIRHKESDRIGDLARELRKLGADVEEMPGGMRITPTALGSATSATIETYDDHRMAMSLGLIGLRVPGIRILDPGCTAKTYPGFFDDLQAITASAQ